MVKFKDIISDVTVEINHPAVFFDKVNGTVFSLGEHDDVSMKYDFNKKVYAAAGYQELADNLEIMTLPDDQEVFDEILEISGKVLHYYEQFKANQQLL